MNDTYLMCTDMDDKIEPKTEQSLPSKTEPTDDELTMPLHDDETHCEALNEFVPIGEQTSIGEFNKTNDSNESQSVKDTILTSSQYLTNQNGVSSINERSWDSHAVTPPVLNTEIVLHGPPKQSDISTSADTFVDSNVAVKLLTGEQKKPDENSNPEYDYIFCVAAINRTTPNNLKLLAISEIDRNVKVDMKPDGSSLNGYAADHSSSSTGSTICGQVEEPFLIPKIPRGDSFMSLSSSGSSIGLHQPKSKPNNILLSKNVYTYPEKFVCQKCNYVYPRISDKFSVDHKDFKSESKNKTEQENVGKSKSKKRTKQMNSNCSSNKTIKKTKQTSENIFHEKTDIKLEEIAKTDEPIDPVATQLIDPIIFDLGNKVLAYWVGDKLFYPATIIDIVSSKYKVQFLSDSVIKSVNLEGLVHSDALKQGTAIGILDDVSQECRVGEIVSINNVNNGEVTYTIDLDLEEVVVPFDKLVLDVDKARLLQEKTVFKSYDRLSMSNVSEGKRIRLSRSTTIKCINSNTTNAKNESSKRKRTKQSSSETNKKRKCLFPESPDPKLIPSTSTGITEEDFEAALHIVSSDSDFDQIREDLTKINMGQLRNSEIDSEHSSPEKDGYKSPVVNDSIKVFKDLHFVLSYAKFKRTPCDHSDQSTDSEVIKSSSYFQPSKVHKKYLRKLITKNGGSVQDYCNMVPRSEYKSTYIITDTPSNTCNYFLGLGLGLPSYHHLHVEKAVIQKLPFTEYLVKNKIEPLPNGWSVEKKTIIHRSPNTVYTRIFENFIIYLAFLERPKNDFFAGLLRFCGAIVYTTWTNGVFVPLTRHTTVIVTDEHCPRSLAKENVPKLSILWLVQSLVCESARPFDGHESFIAINDEQECSTD